MDDTHDMLVILNGLARNQALVGESFDRFKDEVSTALNKIIDDNNIMKQELFILRQKEIQKEQATESVSAPPSSSQIPKPSVPEPRSEKPSKVASEPDSRPPNPVNRNNSGRRKVLFIGDSISGNVEQDVLENTLIADITKVKAYSSVYDNEARFPAKNFKDVAQVELKKEQFDILLLQSGSVDITNLDTKSNPDEHVDYLKQQAVISARNIFSTAVNALVSHPGLKIVVIMNQTPRYDDKSVDPLSLKPVLALLFNNTLTEFWAESKFRAKLAIGSHTLNCSGGVKEARYRDIKHKKYDGLHLYGPS